MITQHNCPRCGEATLEHLSTHSNCWECGFSPDFDSGINSWEQIELSGVRRRIKRRPTTEGRKCHLSGVVS